MKNLLTHLDKECRNAHPFWGFSKKLLEKIYPFTCSHWEVPNYRVFLKNFLSGKKPSHLFGIERPNDTLFHRKIRKYFFGCGRFILLASKKPSHLFPLRTAKCTPWIAKKFLSLHLFGIERSKRTLFFQKKGKKFFWKDDLPQKHPLTCSHWQRTFGDSNFEKG